MKIQSLINGRLITMVALLLTVFLTGCKTELYSSLSEHQANEIVSALNEVGISASREGTETGKFSVEVERSNFSRAIAELSSRGLPRKQFSDLGSVFSSDNTMVQTPRGENALYNFALNQELSASISNIPGVASARVHIMLPETSPYAKEQPNPRASVFIYTARDVDLSRRVPVIKNLIVNAVPNMEYDNVEVAMFNGEPVAGSFGGGGSYGYAPAGDIIGQIIALVVLLGLLVIGWKLLRSISNAKRGAKAIDNQSMNRLG